MIKLFKPFVSDIAAMNVESVLASEQLTQGQVVEDFESQLKHHMGLLDKAVTTNSATSALDLAYELIGIGPGDYVISTPQTCFATNAPLIHRGAKILWADVDLSGLIDPWHVEELVRDFDVKAIVAVDWAGRLPDYEHLQKFGIPVVEDAAHRWDGNLKGRPHGDYVVYSFQAIKFLTCGDGGLLVAPRTEISRARLLRWYGLDRDNNVDFRSTQNIAEAGFKYHMNNISAAIGMANIVGIEDRVDQQRANAEQIIAGIDGLHYVVADYDPRACYWMLPVIVAPDRRSAFTSYLASRGIEANVVHSRNDKYVASEGHVGNPDEVLHGLDLFAAAQTNIPCGWWLTEDDIATIIRTIVEFDEAQP